MINSIENTQIFVTFWWNKNEIADENINEMDSSIDNFINIFTLFIL
jgi:hypothetical protein